MVCAKYVDEDDRSLDLSNDPDNATKSIFEKEKDRSDKLMSFSFSKIDGVTEGKFVTTGAMRVTVVTGAYGTTTWAKRIRTSRFVNIINKPRIVRIILFI
ncbi:MAG: hypothetical protein CV087_09945 [Candidatus Brocadia sp. WS118]|nr:MAG: hypothetical protein CV087_09945 [Candidatus Brocadia sp. WS118]